MFDILVIGSSTEDIFIKIGRFENGCLPVGEKLDADETVYTTGGGASNVAVGFARAGLKVACATRIGNDGAGWKVREEMAKEGVSLFIQQDNARRTAVSFILVAQNGERTIIQDKGANNYFNADEISWEAASARYIYAVDSLGLDDIHNLSRIIERARGMKARFVFTPNDNLLQKKELLAPLIRQVDILIVNEKEAAILAGKIYAAGGERESLDALSKITGGVVVITMGGKGSLASDGKRLYSAGVPDSKVVDRTGAGDAFASGFLSAYIGREREESEAIVAAIQRGTANATAVVEYYGGKNGLLRKGEQDNFPVVDVEVNALD